jgi:hypothetical protein
LEDEDMAFSVRGRSIGGRFWNAARWVTPLAFALAACGGSSSNDDDDGGAGGEDNAGTGGTSGKGGTGSGGTSTAGKGGSAGSASAGKGGSGGTGGSAGKGGSGGTGGGTQIGDCEEFSPCGGNPEGTWRVQETCMEVTFAMLPAGCPDMIQDFDVDVVGTYTFESGTVTTEAAMQTELTLVINDSCARTITGSEMVTAELACPILEQQAAGDPETTMSCEFDGTNCVCLQTQTPAPEKTTSTYQVSGNQLINDQGEALDFCSEGDSLLLQTTNVPSDVTAVSRMTVVLELQRE